MAAVMASTLHDLGAGARYVHPTRCGMHPPEAPRAVGGLWWAGTSLLGPRARG